MNVHACIEQMGGKNAFFLKKNITRPPTSVSKAIDEQLSNCPLSPERR